MSVLSPIYQTIRQLKAELLTTALIGFAGAPFTVMEVEGGSSKDLKTTKKMMMTDPDLFTSILDEVTAITVDIYWNSKSRGGCLANI